MNSSIVVSKFPVFRRPKSHPSRCRISNSLIACDSRFARQYRDCALLDVVSPAANKSHLSLSWIWACVFRCIPSAEHKVLAAPDSKRAPPSESHSATSSGTIIRPSTQAHKRRNMARSVDTLGPLAGRHRPCFEAFRQFNAAGFQVCDELCWRGGD